MTTRVLFFGDRNLTWKHTPVVRALALHASLSHCQDPDGCGSVPPMSMDLMRFLLQGGDDEWPRRSDNLLLIHGDGPPGKTPGAIGADKLSELACMEAWPNTRRVRRFPPEPEGAASWGQAAAQRNQAMVNMKPHLAYCVHQNLDASKGSTMTATFLQNARVRFWYVRVDSNGDVVSVEER